MRPALPPDSVSAQELLCTNPGGVAGAGCEADLSYDVTDETSWELSSTVGMSLTTSVKLGGSGVEDTIE